METEKDKYLRHFEVIVTFLININIKTKPLLIIQEI